MIELRKTGSLFECGAHAIVNPVNCVGVMGKGLALQFRTRYPSMYHAYKQACGRGEVKLGNVWPFELDTTRPQWILNFPTKEHWRDPARIEWISWGLGDLVEMIACLKLDSVALPALGCGEGGLDFALVRPLIENRLGSLDVNVILFAPQ